MYRDLLFSRFDVVRQLLEADFPAIPEDQRRTVARALLPFCEGVFNAYPLGDNFLQGKDFPKMKEELRLSISSWIEDYGAPGYKAKLQNPKRVFFKEDPMRKQRLKHK